MTKRLIALLNGQRVGHVEMKASGTFRFQYDAEWQDRGDAYPLSLSMPLLVSEHSDDVVRPFLEGLLPDSRAVLERIGRDFQVSPRNPFALLTHMGEDCAGAIQLVRPDRLDDFLGSGAHDLDDVEWLSEEDVEERLRDAVARHGTGRLSVDTGHFSLAGAQPKTALLFDGERWGIPHGAVPTTHIIKPPAQAEYDGFDVNEHFCLRLAHHLGLPTTNSFVRSFGERRVIVVERYDREWISDTRLSRIHHEDICQALGVSPHLKYENEGGPGLPDLVSLLRRSSDEQADVETVIDAAALNWAIGGSDAHAKNYSVLIGPNSIRLAPLYDIVSALPYPDRIHARELKLAMRIDREYHAWKIERRHWEGLAERCDLDAPAVVQRVAEVLEAVPAAAGHTAEEVRTSGVSDQILDRLEEAIGEHVKKCLTALS